MRNFLHCLFILLITALMPTGASASTFYSKVTVKADSGIGKVYVSTSDTSPADNAYTNEMSATNSGSGQNNATTTYYIKAKFAEGHESGYTFLGWYYGNDLVSSDFNYKLDVTANSKTESSPTSYTYVAKFIETPAVLVSSDEMTTATISKTSNKIGDLITVTATPLKIADINGGRKQESLIYGFDHWEDGDGNFVSDEPTYSFTITEPLTLKAVGKDIVGKPVPGGYYRIRNYINRVLKIEGNFTLNSTSDKDPAGGRGMMASKYQLRWALPTGHDYSKNITWAFNGRCDYTDDPEPVEVETLAGTVMYLAGTQSNEKITNAHVSAQGVDTKTLTGYDFTISPSDSKGYYYFSNSLAAPKMRLRMPTDENGNSINILACDVYVGSAAANDVTCAMALQPLDEEHMDMYWFGAKPDESMNVFDGYWTTMYTAFPYECRDGVEAYYIKKEAPLSVNGKRYLVMTRIEDGRVPANTAVMLKCQGLTSKENRLLPLDPATVTVAALTDNALLGEIQLYTDRDGNGRKTFDQSTMRVLGKASDNVGFYKLKPLDEGGPATLEPNKAYLDLSWLPADEIAASYMIRIDDNGMAGIESIKDENDSVKYENQIIYDLKGNRVVNPSSGNIYIVNGNKILWK